jgi:hypothetical protein
VKRALWIAGIAVAIVLCAAPFLPLPFLRPSLEQALARRLGRRVDIDEVSLSFLTGPGFALSGVTIHEDPRAGIEPFVYAQTVDARVDLLGLIAGRRGFSSLRLSDATLNLVKTDAGPWNFQYLFGERLVDEPAVHVRGARVNLKLGQTKSVLYFDAADLDISAGDQGSLDLSFSGVPGRTDRAAQDFGQLFVQGSWMPSSADRPLNLKVELEASSFDGMAKLFGRSWFDLQVQVLLEAQLSGLPSRLAVTGEIQLDEGRRSDFLPNHDAQWKLPYRGTLDLTAERVELESAPAGNAKNAGAEAGADLPLHAHFEAANLLTSPAWKASVELNDEPLSVVIDAAHRIGAPLPEKLAGAGTVSGSLEYGDENGIVGSLEARAATFTLPDAPLVKAASVPVKFDARTVTFGPCVLTLGDKPTASQSAQMEASYKFDGSMAADVKVTTRGLDLAGVEGFAAVPLLGRAVFDQGVPDQKSSDGAAPDRTDPMDAVSVSRGLWRGSIRYQRADREEGTWTGDYTVENVRIPVDGIADPIRIRSASVSVAAGRLAVTKMKAKVGDIAFTGEYHWAKTTGISTGEIKAGNTKAGDVQAGDNQTERPHKFKLQIAEASASELDRLFQPSLVRGGGFIQRTMRLGGASPVPDWLAQRQAEGAVAIAALTVGDHRFAVDSSRLVWDGTSLRFSAVNAHLLDAGADGASLKGELAIDLSDAAPQYRVTGKLAGIPYKGGRLDFDGRIEAAGDGPPLLASLHAAGALNGRSIAFSPDTDFRNVNGRFDASLQGTSLRWKFTDLELTQGADVYQGEGTAQADGKVVLDLTNRGKQVRYTGSLVSLAAQP